MKTKWRIVIDVEGPEKDGSTFQLANEIPLFEINRLLRGTKWHGVGIAVQQVKEDT
jgi:hypothetical protein